jgi:hypothetical protein
LAIAPANVLQGAVRLHGLASSPTPDTHVLVAWALAITEKPPTITTNVNNRKASLCIFTVLFPPLVSENVADLTGSSATYKYLN